MLRAQDQTMDDVRMAREARERLRKTIASQALPDPEAALKRARELLQGKREEILQSRFNMLEPSERRAVEKAAKRYRCEYIKQGGKCRLSFEELYGEFSTNRSFGSIARGGKAGVSYKTIQFLYWCYFAEFFPYANGYERGTKRAQDRRRVHRATLAKEKPKDPVLRLAMERAETCGCKTKQIFVAFKKNSHHKVTTRRFHVNWNLCTLRLGSITKDRRYAVVQCFRSELEQYDGVVVYVQQPSETPVFFVVPRKKFIEIVFGTSDKDCIYPLFPLGPAKKPGRSMLLAEFREAWHLLKPKHESKTPA